MEEIGDLRPDMILEGVVTNVAAFGAFVDIGVHQDGLVHISALSNTFVKDPHTVVKAGQVVKVKVLEVDVKRKRIALTMRLTDSAPQPGSQAGAARRPQRRASAWRSTSSRSSRRRRARWRRRSPSCASSHALPPALSPRGKRSNRMVRVGGRRWQHGVAAAHPAFSYKMTPFNYIFHRGRTMSDVQTWIKETVTSTPVVLFMKGTAQFPQCGFSGRAIQILKACGVENIATVNVLEDPEVRQGIKDFSNWPTIPQLYVNGEFIGGSDIMNEMYRIGRTASPAQWRQVMTAPRRLVVAITGATGAIYGVRLLQQLAATPGVETHLVVSDAASLTLHQEVGMQRRDVEALAHVVHKQPRHRRRRSPAARSRPTAW